MALSDVKGRAQKPASIHTICADLLLVLFENLDRTTAVCLGLTCRTFHVLFKHIYPEKTPLLCSTTISTPGSQDPKRRVFLHELLATWIGPSYFFFPEDWGRGCKSYFLTRLGRYCSPVFLNVKVYGGARISSTHWSRRTDLGARWKDYRMSKGRLPRPFGRGKEWYEEARMVVMGDERRVEDPRAWEAFWRRMDIFEWVGDEERWRWFMMYRV